MITCLGVAEGAELADAAVSPPKASAQDGDGLLSSLSFTSQKGPVTITAQTMEFDYKTRNLIYRGEVLVSQSDMTLRAKVLRVTLDEEADEPIREIVAEGDVRITKGNRSAKGGRLIFEQANRTVVLTENPVVRDGQNELAGEKITVFLNEERSVVEGGVKAKLFPGSSESGEPKLPGAKDPGNAADGR